MWKEENTVEFKVLSHYLSGKGKKHTQKKDNFLSQDSQHPGKYHNNTIPRYKSETLKHAPACL
jgi:hypothetical protein